MAEINMSLDDIIKQRFQKNTPNRKDFNSKRKGKPVKRLTIPTDIPDARLKLIQIKRNSLVGNSRIQRDARYKLEALRQRAQIGRRFGVPGSNLPQSDIFRRNKIGDPLLRKASAPMETADYALIPKEPALLCTIRNEGLSRRPFDWDRPAEEMDDIDRFGRLSLQPRDFRADDSELRSIKISVRNSPATMGILKRPSSLATFRVPQKFEVVALSDRFSSDRSVEAASRMKALKAHLQATSQTEVKKPETGHRIVVSNLLPTVSHDDVRELFGDIGELISSKVVRPGVAEVVYRRYEDAARAVDVYHDRQLDDQPMKCLLVKSNQSYLQNVGRNMADPDMGTLLRNAVHKKYTS